MFTNYAILNWGQEETANVRRS